MARKKRLHIADYKALAIEAIVELKMQVWKTEQILKQTNRTIYKGKK